MAAKAALKAIGQAKICKRDQSHSRRNGHARYALSRDGLFRSEEDRSNQRRLSRVSAACAGFLFALEIRAAIYHVTYTRYCSCDRAEKLTSILIGPIGTPACFSETVLALLFYATAVALTG